MERRLYTAGKHKGFLDPFSPEQAPEVEHLQTVLKDLHEEFINVVKRGRGDKLADDEKLFSGFVWTGRQGIELGLVDELASASTVARDVVGVERIVDFTPRKGLFERTLSQIRQQVLAPPSRLRLKSGSTGDNQALSAKLGARCVRRTVPSRLC